MRSIGEPQLPAADEARRLRNRALAAVAVLGVVVLGGLGLRFAVSEPSPAARPASGGRANGADTPGIPPEAAPASPAPRVTQSGDDIAGADGFGRVIITASQHRANFLVDGKKVSSSAPFQLDHLDASRPHTLEVSLGVGKPTVLQRFVVVAGDTVILNVRFDSGGGGKVVGSESATASGPTGAIRVETNPSCVVIIDGKRAGISPLKVRVPVGAHRVSLEPTAGGEPRAIEVKVNEGKVAVVSATF